MKHRESSWERRRWPRAKVPAAVQLIVEQRLVGNYAVENLSAGGALLSGGPPVPLGTVGEVVVHLGARRRLFLLARIIRSGEAIAVAFQDLPSNTEDLLQNLVLTELEEQRKRTPPSALIVDDSEMILQALERQLAALGHVAAAATTPLEAVQHLLDHEHSIRVAIVDLSLGCSDGLEFLAYLAEEHPAVRRVLMSGTVRACQLSLAVRRQRAHAALVKPWTQGQLSAAIFA
jgi:CheY-like chemotaxis protein